MRYYTGVGASTRQEAMILNRKIHKEGFRCCHCCFEIFPKTKEYFYSKTKQGQLSSNCKSCDSKRARDIKLKQKNDPYLYCKRLATSVRSRAKEVGVDFNIDGDYLYSLLVDSNFLCFYTGKPLDFTVENEDTRTPHREMPSLDRKNPSLGYVRENVVWCLFFVNRMKNDLSLDEFLEVCKNVLEKHEV